MKEKDIGEGSLKKIRRSRGRKISMALAVTALVGVTLSAACSSMSRKDYEGDRKMNIEKSANFKNKKFANLDGNSSTMTGSTWETLKELFFGGQQRVPKKPLEVVRVDPKALTGGGGDELKVTWLGHSFTIIEMEGNLILTDPMLGKRPSPVSFMGPKRYHRNLPLDPSKLPEIDLVIISHDHYDHLDYDMIQTIKKKVKHFIVPLGVGAYLEKWGVPEENISELDWWRETVTAKGLRIAAAPAQHFSGRKFFNGNDTLWASWVIIGRKHRVFFSGDSGYNPSFKKIGEKYGPFDVTLMENGQYNKNWERVHMLPEQTLQAHLDVRGKILIPIHWGAYNLSIHDWTEPVERILKAAAKNRVTVATPRIGQTWKYGDAVPVARWWPDILKIKKQVAGGKTVPATVALSEE